MQSNRSDERGATLVEAAIAYSLLFLTLFAVVEFGLAFKDWLSVSQASREGARAGATFGDDPSSDILVLRDVQSTMVPIGLKPGDQVRIFDAIAGTGTTYSFAPGNLSDCSNSPPLQGCCDWTPCPEVGRALYQTPTWDPASRDITAPVTDRIGVQIFFVHSWITGWFGNDLNLNTSTDFQIEPQLFEAP